MKLEQTYLFSYQSFELTETGMFCNVKEIFSQQQILIPYEDIAFNRISKRTYINKYFIVILILIGITLFNVVRNEASTDGSGMLMAIIGICFGGFLVFDRFKKKELIIPTHGTVYITIFEDKPNKTAVEEFIDKLRESIKLYMLKKYATIDKDLPLDPQLTNLVVLKNAGILTEEEFEELKKIALGKDNQNTIGFKKS